MYIWNVGAISATNSSYLTVLVITSIVGYLWAAKLL